MLRSTLILCALSACISLALPVSAQNGLGRIVDTVSKLDRNFDTADRNRDGLLSKEEAVAGRVGFVARNFDAIDTAKRGVVSKDDVHAYIRDMLMQGQRAPAAAASSTGH